MRALFPWKSVTGILLSAFVLAPISTSARVMDHTLNAVIFQQRASEYRALCYQAFNAAKVKLDAELEAARKKVQLPLAVVTDVDEAILSNAPYQADLILSGKEFPSGMEAWVEAAVADTVPGSLEFLQYAHAKGVKVFYVTNRGTDEKEGTIKNLKKRGFPDPSVDTVLVRTNQGSKDDRRRLIEQKYTIALLVGDNLGDHATEFDVVESADRLTQVDRAKAAFGNRYIVIPNPVYGDWEKVAGNLRGLTSEEKRVKRLRALEPFRQTAP